MLTSQDGRRHFGLSGIRFCFHLHCSPELYHCSTGADVRYTLSTDARKNITYLFISYQFLSYILVWWVFFLLFLLWLHAQIYKYSYANTCEKKHCNKWWLHYGLCKYCQIIRHLDGCLTRRGGRGIITYHHDTHLFVARQLAKYAVITYEQHVGEKKWNDWWAGDNLGKWDEFCYEYTRRNHAQY